MNQDRVGPSIAVNGATVRHLRTFTGHTVTALAREIGCTPAYISRIESGRARRVGPAVFASLRTALGVVDIRVLMADPHAPVAAADAA